MKEITHSPKQDILTIAPTVSPTRRAEGYSPHDCERIFNHLLAGPNGLAALALLWRFNTDLRTMTTVINEQQKLLGLQLVRPIEYNALGNFFDHGRPLHEYMENEVMSRARVHAEDPRFTNAVTRMQPIIENAVRIHLPTHFLQYTRTMRAIVATLLRDHRISPIKLGGIIRDRFNVPVGKSYFRTPLERIVLDEAVPTGKTEIMVKREILADQYERGLKEHDPAQTALTLEELRAAQEQIGTIPEETLAQKAENLRFKSALYKNPTALALAIALLERTEEPKIAPNNIAQVVSGFTKTPIAQEAIFQLQEKIDAAKLLRTYVGHDEVHARVARALPLICEMHKDVRWHHYYNDGSSEDRRREACKRLVNGLFLELIEHAADSAEYRGHFFKLTFFDTQRELGNRHKIKYRSALLTLTPPLKSNDAKTYNARNRAFEEFVKALTIEIGDMRHDVPTAFFKRLIGADIMRLKVRTQVSDFTTTGFSTSLVRDVTYLPPNKWKKRRGTWVDTNELWQSSNGK